MPTKPTPKRSGTDELRRGTRPSSPERNRRVVVKFHDVVRLPYEDGAEKHLLDQKIGQWQRIATLLPGGRLRRLYTALEGDKMKKLIGRAIKATPSYKPPNFLTYFVLDCPTTREAKAVVKELRSWDAVQSAYIAQPVSDPQVNLIANVQRPLWQNQLYLDPAPGGIDAKSAWNLQGGDGASQTVIDLEQGWTLDHQDLITHQAVLLPGGANVNHARGHGTAVLGVICAAGEPDRCVGIAPHVAAVKVASYNGVETQIPNTILTVISELASGNLSPGDVLVLEVETAASRFPCETDSAAFDMIQLATRSGLVVVEAAGNGDFDLDNYRDENGNDRLNRNSDQFADSGAIMVGAGRFNPDGNANFWTRLPGSNSGSRINCFAAGETVFTTFSTWKRRRATTNEYRNFGGTSSATAIVAGAALSVQGISEAKSGSRLSPEILRQILSNPANGTPSQKPDKDEIGVMPDLSKISAIL